jgi:hypothetical protein
VQQAESACADLAQALGRGVAGMMMKAGTGASRALRKCSIASMPVVPKGPDRARLAVARLVGRPTRKNATD